MKMFGQDGQDWNRAFPVCISKALLLCVYNPALVNALSEGMVCEVIKLNDLI
jgi:hypothetical protein